MKLLDNGIFWQKNTLKKGKLVLLTILRIDRILQKAGDPILTVGTDYLIKPYQFDAVFSFDLSDVVKLGEYSPPDVKQRSFRHEFKT